MAVKYDDKYKQYYIKGTYKSPDGEYKQYTRFSGKGEGFKSKKAAEKADREFREEMQAAPETKTGITVGEAKEMYFKAKKRTVKSSTIYTAQKALKFTEPIDDYDVGDVTEDNLQSIIDLMDEDGYSLNYIDKVFTNLGAVFRFLKKKKIIVENPMENVEMTKRPDEYQDEPNNFWTQSEFDLFLSNVDDPLYRTMFTTYFYTGRRCSEITGLTWKKVDLNKHTYRIDCICDQSVPGQPYTITPPKTPNSVGTHRMPDVLYNSLKQWHAVQSKMYNFSPKWFVFGGFAPISESTLNKRFTAYKNAGTGWVKEEDIDGLIEIGNKVKIKSGTIYSNAKRKGKTKTYFKEVEIDEIIQNPEKGCLSIHVKTPIKTFVTLHGLRHSHVTILINNGANIKAIADRIGDTVQQVLKTYAHLLPENEEDLCNIVDRIALKSAPK